MLSPRRLHIASAVLILQVPFFICRYLLLNIQVPFSTRQQAIHGTVFFTLDSLTPHTAFPSLPATVPLFWNVSTHFFYPCVHSVVASSTPCRLNRRKLNTYQNTRQPSWENGTWQVPSQLPHSGNWNAKLNLWLIRASRHGFYNMPPDWMPTVPSANQMPGFKILVN